jgi:hypothetical protein
MSSSRHFPLSSATCPLTPVMFLPGRERSATKSSARGSTTNKMLTIGMVLVARRTA